MKKPKLLLPLLTVTTLVLLGTSGYFYKQYQESQKQVKALKTSPEQTNKELIDKIGKLVVLPEGEDPTIATVVDPDKLKDQIFFAKAKKGDKILLYTNAKKAILYDPTANKIVEVAPINIGTPSPSPSPSPSPTTAPRK